MHGETPFLTACRTGVWQFVVALLEKGAIHSVIDNNGRTALHYASTGLRFHYIDDKLFEMLLESCDVNAQDSDGNTALHLGCATGEINQSLVKTFLKVEATRLAANIRIKNKAGETILLCKIENQCA